MEAPAPAIHVVTHETVVMIVIVTEVPGLRFRPNRSQAEMISIGYKTHVETIELTGVLEVGAMVVKAVVKTSSPMRIYPRCSGSCQDRILQRQVAKG